VRHCRALLLDDVSCGGFEGERENRERERERERERDDGVAFSFFVLFFLNLDLDLSSPQPKKCAIPKNRWAILFVAQSHPLVRPVLQA
jgi:hypothetical protein